MRLTLMLLGVVLIIEGVLLYIFTDASRDFLRSLLRQKNMKLLAVIDVIAGLLLLLGSPAVSAPWITTILGIAAIGKGVFLILAPEKRSKPLIDWWINASSSLFRSWGVVAFLLGILILLIL